VNQLIIRSGYAVKTLESKETRAQRKKTITHNSVFAAHRLNAVLRLQDGIFFGRGHYANKLRGYHRLRRNDPRASFGGWPKQQLRVGREKLVSTF
jgi:hypothetical protein